MANYFITIAGNIGVGKSTLTRLLAERLDWEPVYEAVTENPYLADFYEDMRRWSFHSQVFFLSRRLRQHHNLLQKNSSVIQDRSVYEDAEVFARNLYRQGHLSQRDWRCYLDLYETLATLLRPPDLVVYLQASVDVLMKRVQTRGRPEESHLSEEYLGEVNRAYNHYFFHYGATPLLVVNTTDVDFASSA
ncbi:MAG TPA: deoxynucleoside kinase, partial [Chloroflexi bacterium]|nr:deoxynucleoside kinase [Chloroflexota bacterium]